jgi:hypothetical protein
MPVRFTSPRLAGIGDPQLEKHRWQLHATYRHLGAGQWYVGTKVQESAAPFGKPLSLNTNSVDLSLDYNVTDRLGLRLTLPFSYGTHSRFYADGNRHTVSAAGLGDISLVASRWLFEFAKHSRGNLALGVGVKMPTGNNSAADDFFLADSSIVQRPVDQSIQLGDGGWGIILQAQGHWNFSKKFSGYAQAWYLLTPREHTSVPSPLAGVTLSVPDVYAFRLGSSYIISQSRGISASFGPRLDGLPLRDRIGGNAGFRRPGYSLYLEPGVTLAQRGRSFTLSIPLRVHQNFRRSLVDIQLNKGGGGDLARYLILAGYSWRF